MEIVDRRPIDCSRTTSRLSIQFGTTVLASDSAGGNRGSAGAIAFETTGTRDTAKIADDISGRADAANDVGSDSTPVHTGRIVPCRAIPRKSPSASQRNGGCNGTIRRCRATNGLAGNLTARRRDAPGNTTGPCVHVSPSNG